MSDDINRALVADDGAKAELLTRALHERAIQRIETIDAAGADEKCAGAWSLQVSTPRLRGCRHFAAAPSSCCATCWATWRTACRSTCAFEREQIDQVKALVEAAAAQITGPRPARKTDIFVCGLVWSWAGWRSPGSSSASRRARRESDDAARVAETPFANAVAIVLSEIECMVSGCASSSRRAARPPRC